MTRIAGRFVLTAALGMAVVNSGTPAVADPILSLYGSGTPVNSWAYSEAVGVGKGNSSVYVPLVGDAVGLSFQGYVFYPGGNGWLNTDPSFYDEDTIREFRTYLLADKAMSLSIVVGIDDGHSIYVNNAFVSGNVYGVNSTATISLQPNVPVLLGVLGYNGPGPSEVVVVRDDSGLPIESTQGLRISADGNFSAVPEPSSMVMAATAALMGLGFAWHRRTRAAA